ncbi:stress-responsive transcription factor hsf1 [Monascus purpureus]|uniref:Stress-responsive transcription factor hsf1 n=1 Tax=Monascus purpureus TaxID=5098 RepID=A0A507R2K5_MONPU|nr:stress-responsive transcription factor hsf1 [Monascus purpureus]BDD58901.1 hypothetical protein MAP00_004142 [Monascus purpureus]
MTSQGVSRKRPAPGTSPIVHPAIPAMSNFPPNPGSQLSNDQFLQWGQNPPAAVVNPASFPDAGSYSAPIFPATQDVPTAPPTTTTTTATNTTSTTSQLARRQPPNQLVSRGRGYDQSPTIFSDSGTSTSEPAGGWGESLDHLYQRALIAKKDAQAKRKQIPPFVQKLSSFLDESKNTDLIRWSDDGNSFIVLDEDEFARTLIPELFKHNNYASFVRQLNMYGFHKKVGLSDNSMRASERKNKSPSEYANPYFKRGHPDLLWLIQKPKNTGQGAKSAKANMRVKAEDGDDHEADDYGEDASRDDRGRSRSQLSLISNGLLPKDQLAGVYRELQAIRQQQQIISNTINKLRREHEQLCAQAANFQEQHTRHENSINAILTFLATVYNRSLQGQDGSPNLANSLAGAISQDQGNVVDMGDDYSLSSLNSGLNSPNAQKTLKKQPLLLKAPPVPVRQGRTPALSPSSNVSLNSSRSHIRQPSAPGHVEEVFDNSPRQNNTPDSIQTDSFPQRDIMSVIQNSNARSGMPSSYTDFPNVLSSLENSGGQIPLTPNQRADMLRLMANETNSADPNVSATSNNALITPTPPPMPHNYTGRLANTRAEIDNLVKMQAEQDRSVQNLTDLLQPLSPTGTIPGLGRNGANVPPPPLDLDQIFNNDYFTDIDDVDSKHNLGFGDSTTSTGPAPAAGLDNDSIKDANDLFDFDHLPAEGDLFGDTSATTNTPQNAGYFGGFDGTSVAGKPINSTAPDPNFTDGNNNIDSGRVIETLTDSEGTSPSNTVAENSPQIGAKDSQGTNGNDNKGKRRRLS